MKHTMINKIYTGLLHVLFCREKNHAQNEFGFEHNAESSRSFTRCGKTHVRAFELGFSLYNVRAIDKHTTLAYNKIISD